MSLLIKIVLGIGAVILVVGSTLVTFAALFPPKEHEEGRIKDDADGDKWEESREDV